MSDPFESGADTHFAGGLPDWRGADIGDDPDDEVLDETPADVVAVLGFDPLELDDLEKYAAQFDESKVKRDDGGKFADKEGAGDNAGMDMDKRMLRAELSEFSNDDLEAIRQQHNDDGTRRTAKKIMKERGVEIVGPGKAGSRKKEPRGKVLVNSREDTVEDTDREEMLSVSQAIEDAGGTQNARSESGSRYYTLPDGRGVRISNHTPNAATQNWMENENIVDVRLGDGSASAFVDSLRKQKRSPPE